jgi:protoporphyrinogen oxidase
MKIGIIGAGITGLTAAYELGKAGHQVTIFEQAAQAGGLAGTFKDERWEWPLEIFYHHAFTSDRALRNLSKELGIGDKMFFPLPVTAIWQNGTVNAFDSPLAVLRYPYLSFLDKMRVGLTTLYLRLTKNWQPLEQVTAEAWLLRYIGPHAYHMLWEPLLANKMTRYYKEIPMAWFWARIHKRSQRLGYYIGGYQTLTDALEANARARGVAICYRSPVTRVDAEGTGYRLHVGEAQHVFDAVVATVSPQAMLRLAPPLPETYQAQVRQLKALGALTLILTVDRQVTDGFYWINLPQGQFPFLAFVEHTNYQSPEHYGGDHILYLGDYPAPDEPHWSASKEDLLAEFLPHLNKFNAAFDPSWVRKSWLFREEYAQPVPPLNYSRQMPAVRTPLPGLYFASMSQVYPWDRGTNYSVEMGQGVAEMVLEDAQGNAHRVME